MPTKDASWQLVYDATGSNKLSATFGSSSGTATPIPVRGAIGIEIKCTTITLAAGTHLLLTPVITDADSSADYPQRRDGTPARQKITTANYMTPPFWFNGPLRSGTTDGTIGVEPWLNTADATAKCKVYVKRIYPDR